MIPQYPVIFRQHIHSCFAGVSSNDVWLERKVMMPFPPFPGLDVVEGGWGTRVEEVSVNLDPPVTIVAYSASDKTLYHADLHSWPVDQRPSLEDIVAEYLEWGWQIARRRDAD